MTAASARDGVVVLTLRDRDAQLRRVRLVHELFRPRVGPDFSRAATGRPWRLRLPRLPVDRFEYQLELTARDGTTDVVCDPGNPLRAEGPFGPKSVAELPGYRPPSWLDHEPPPGVEVPLEVPSPALRKPLRATIWSSPGAAPGRRVPLLLVHDGHDYRDYSALLRFLGAAVEGGVLRPHRAALLVPVDRDQTYSASAAYARTVASDLLPAVMRAAPTRDRPRWRVAIGASLGALAALHLHRSHHDLLGALFLQSGSFFDEQADAQESGFARFERITRFVRRLHEGRRGDPIPVTMTCGTVEESLGNNRATAAALAAQGYDVRLHENRDAHNWTGWRDALDPYLLDILRRAWA